MLGGKGFLVIGYLLEKVSTRASRKEFAFYLSSIKFIRVFYQALLTFPLYSLLGSLYVYSYLNLMRRDATIFLSFVVLLKCFGLY